MMLNYFVSIGGDDEVKGVIGVERLRLEKPCTSDLVSAMTDTVLLPIEMDPGSINEADDCLKGESHTPLP